MTDPDWPAETSSARVRTDLAWVRTALSLVGLAVLVARQARSVPVAVVVLAVALPSVAWLVVDVQRREPARAAAMAAGRNVAAPTPVLALMVLTVALASVALVLVAT